MVLSGFDKVLLAIGERNVKKRLELFVSFLRQEEGAI
jgi:hypothetical protein